MSFINNKKAFKTRFDYLKAMGSGSDKMNNEAMQKVNNIVKNGRNHGISIQGARNITIANNLSYNNAGAGFYGNYFMSDVLISNNQLLDNKYGIYVSFQVYYCNIEIDG